MSENVEEIKKVRQRVVLQHEDVNVSDMSLFRPKSARALFEDYPELAKYPEAKELHSQDLLFCWYFACETSPIYRIKDKKGRAKQAIYLAYKSIKKSQGGKTLTTDEEINIENLRFSPKLASGIKMFSKFRLNPRLRAKIITERAFENLEKILNIDADDNNNFLNADGGIDYSKKKAYVDTIAKSMDILPSLIDKLEHGFGVSLSSEESGDSDLTNISFADMYHDLNK